MEILGVRIDNVAKKEALVKAAQFLHSNSQHIIFTPNPEMLVDSQKDHYFQEVLNKGDLNLCDGKGIQLVSKEKVERIPGVDFMMDLCELAQKEEKTVYLLGSGEQKTVETCKKNLQKQFPKLRIVGLHPGIVLTNLPNNQLTYDSGQNDELLQNIIFAAPDILFVAFGHGKQEKWIYENLPHLPSVKIAMGVGGAFDYISKKVNRAPAHLRNLGLEWLYRLVKEPQRISRIWKATGKFLFLFYIKKK
jgi:N-acetylglucosaminyldiphosphoundecaprenol N-acetyl-beta-D-mannosaminyltransferase